MKDEPIGEPLNPCPSCGEHINDDILASSPDCPHGWASTEGMAFADLKALFADDCHGPGLSLDLPSDSDGGR